jgi:hypothetical protein
MTTSGLRADARWPLPRGLIVVLSMTGLLVSVLALKQFAGIVAPVLLALILVISFHPLIGILRGRGVPQWLAVTITLLALIAVILGMAISMGLSVGRLATILPNYQAQFEQLANELRAWLGSLGVGQDQVNEATRTYLLVSTIFGLIVRPSTPASCRRNGRNSGRTADTAHESAAARRGPEHPVDVRPHHRRPRPARGCGGRRGDHPRRAEAGLGRSRLAGSRFGGRQPAGYRPRRRRVDPHS